MVKIVMQLLFVLKWMQTIIHAYNQLPFQRLKNFLRILPKSLLQKFLSLDSLTTHQLFVFGMLRVIAMFSAKCGMVNIFSQDSLTVKLLGLYGKYLFLSFENKEPILVDKNYKELDSVVYGKLSYIHTQFRKKIPDILRIMSMP